MSAHPAPPCSAPRRRGANGLRRSPSSASTAILTTLLSIAILLVGSPSSAQFPQDTRAPRPRQYVTRVWQNEDGLPADWVSAVTQDRQGYLWVAAFGGVARFDGVRFTAFNPPGNLIRTLAVCASRDGTLWIGTADYGVTRVQDGKATTLGEREGLPSSFVGSIVEDRRGHVWVNTSKGTVRFAGATFEPYPTHRGTPVTEFLLEQSDGTMWFRAGKDVVRFAPQGTTAKLHGGNIIQEDRDGSVWIAFHDAPRLVRYHRGVFTDVPLPKTRRPRWAGAFPEQAVAAMATDTNGDLLLLTAGGIARAANGRLTPPEPVSLPGNENVVKATSMTVDREGNIWIGTQGPGLVRARPAPLTAYGKSEGLSDESFNTVFQDRKGRVWLGGDSLYWFDGSSFHVLPGIADVRAITQTHDGDLWFGGSGGLYRWRAGVLSRFEIADPAVTHIFQDRSGTMWIQTQTYERPGGLYRFRDGSLELVHRSRGGKIMEDRRGGIWQGITDAGLRYMRDGKAVLHEQALGTAADMYQDSENALWFTSYGVGLFRFRDGQYKRITVKDGLPNDRVGSFIVDGSGFVWISSDHNIFRIRLQDLADLADGKLTTVTPVTYGVAEGMKSSECNGGDPAGWRTSDGRMWFPTVRGVVAIDPTRVNRIAPPVVLEEARANDSSFSAREQSVLPPGASTFDFRFTALSLSAPEKVRFRYRLDPYDTRWVEAGTQRTAHYTNMAPGTYSFRVIAANDFGVWNEQGASVRFVLQPRYYQTAWFRALCGMIVLVLLWGTYRVRLRQLHHQFERTLNARVDERTRIARELHDTLLQGAHGMLLQYQTVSQLLPEEPSAAKERLDHAIAQTAAFVTEARDQVQGLRTSTVDTNDLALAISTLGAELPSASTTDRPAAIRVAVEGETRSLRPIVRDEIYKIAAEALRNAFRHAEARRIEVDIRYDSEQFRLRVRDDGRGIDPAVLAARGTAGHYGLRGMTERAEVIGGDLAVWSRPDEGTEVELRVPASAAYATPQRRAWFLRKSDVRRGLDGQS